MEYHDPFVPSFNYEGMAMASVHDLDAAVAMADCVVVVTDHDAYDWDKITQGASLIVDTRHAIKR